MTRLNPTLRAALTSADRGFHLFPLVPGEKRPAKKAWEQIATTDPVRITAFWTSRPTYGVAVACGPSGLLVLDLDQPKPGKDTPPPEWQRPGIVDGRDVLAALCEDAGQDLPPATYTVVTPSGGRHLYYAQPDGMRLRNTQGDRGGLGWLIDTRGHGGYVAAPGTTTTGTGAYTILDDAPVAELPGWLADQLAALAEATAVPEPAGSVQLRTGHLSRYAASALRAETDHVRAVTTGGRNRALFIAAQNLGQLVAGRVLDEATARDALRSAAAVHIGVEEFTEREAERTITSGLAAGAKRPRQVAA